MKNLNINPIGLKGNQINERMKELMGITSINENTSKSAVELTKIGPDGKVYAIVRENHEYYIKTSDKTTGLIAEDFKYIGGLQNKKLEAYPSYAKAIKHLNLNFKSLAEAYGKGGDINVFVDDNLLTENPIAGGFSSQGGNGFSGSGNLEGNTALFEEMEDEEEIESLDENDDLEDDELTEAEKAIDSMLEEINGPWSEKENNYSDDLFNHGSEIDPTDVGGEITHDEYDLVEYLKSVLIEKGLEITPDNISIASLLYPGGTITDLDKISMILSQTQSSNSGVSFNESLKKKV